MGRVPGQDVPLDEALGRVTASPCGRRFLRRAITPARWTVMPSARRHARRDRDRAGSTQVGAEAQVRGHGRSFACLGRCRHHDRANTAHRRRAIEIQASDCAVDVGQADGRGYGRHRTGAAANHILTRLTWARLRAAVMPPSRCAQAARGDHSHGNRVGDGRTGRRHGVKPGDIIEYNSLVLASQVRQWGGEPTRFPIVPDDYERIKATVLEAAATHDLVLVNAGSSAGSEDFTARIVQELGTLLVHGVAVRPGHPVILGIIAKRNEPRAIRPSIAHLPSSACRATRCSCALTGEIFVEPIFRIGLDCLRVTNPSCRRRSRASCFRRWAKTSGCA